MSDEVKRPQAEGNGGESKAQPSGPAGDNPATAGAKKNEAINPSSPGETGTTEKK
jgi:hypothetical protein